MITVQGRHYNIQPDVSATMNEWNADDTDKMDQGTSAAIILVRVIRVSFCLFRRLRQRSAVVNDDNHSDRSHFAEFLCGKHRNAHAAVTGRARRH